MPKASDPSQQLDLNLLRVFRALYNEQSMTRAADVLNVTPSAVSHAVARLRTALDDKLFERRENRMLPTATCRRIAPELITALNQLQRVLQGWSEFDPRSDTHSFRIGMHDALEPSVLPRLTKSITQRAPNLSFSSVFLDRSTLAKDLAAGVLDIALDVSIPTNREVRSIPLINNKFVVLMRRAHPLANDLNKTRYLAASHLVVSRRASGLSIEDSQFLEAGHHRQKQIRCQNYAAARDMVAETNLLLTLSSALAERLVGDDLVIRELPISLPGFATQLYWHDSFHDDPALTWLRATIIELFESQT